MGPEFALPRYGEQAGWSEPMTITKPISTNHVVFTEEHQALRASIRAFVDREVVPHVAEWEEHTFPDSIVRRMGELGFLGLSVPTEYGGQGGDYICNLVLAEEVARGGSGGFLMGLSVHTDMVIPPVLKFGTEEQKRRWVRPGVAGEKIYSLGITEPDAGSDLAAIKTHAVRRDGGWVINGSKTFVTNGHRCDMIILVTKTDPAAGHHGFTLFLVPMDAPGVTRPRRLRKMGMNASDTALLSFDDVWVDGSAVLGTVNEGFEHIMWELQVERLIGAAGCLAYGQYAFDRTLDYARQRHTFGRPLGHHQAIRHKFADMAIRLEAARALVYQTARNYARGDDAVREISMCKLLASRTAWEVADQCVQIHGGAGYLDECDVSRVLRDIRVYRFGSGADEIMLDAIGRSYRL